MAANSSTLRIVPFQLQIQSSFLLLLAVLALVSKLNAGAFMGLVLSIAAHEAGHLIMATATGIPVNGFGANWMGCYIRRQDVKGGAGVLTALAGPLATLILVATTSGLVQTFNIGLFLVSLISDGRNALRALR